MDLFILKSGRKFTDKERTIKSFDGISLTSVNFPNTIEEINGFEKHSEFFFVIYDEEFLSKELNESLLAFTNSDRYDVLRIYKTYIKEKRAFICPRIFRKTVKLRSDCLIPERIDEMRTETILNGWLYA